MDIKQKLEDIKLLVKNDRRVLAGIIAGIVVLILWSATSGPKKARNKRTTGYEDSQPGDPRGAEAGSEAYQNLLAAFREEVNSISSSQREQQSTLERMDKEQSQHREKMTGVLEMITERLENQEDAIRRLETEMQTKDSSAPQTVAAEAAPVDNDSLEAIGFPEPPPAPPPPAPPTLERRSFISPGDTVSVTLLTGVAAPVDGTPYPVVFKLSGPIKGPDGSSLDLGEARIIAAAQGSETDARVIYRLTDLSFRHRDGRRSVVKIDGWVVGEDGIRGMRGRVIDKLGQVIAATAGYSFVAALGENIDRRRQRVLFDDLRGADSVTITGNDVDSATASALTDSSNRLGQMLLDKYEKMIPVVEVSSGRDVAAIFARGAEVSVMEDEEEEGGLYTAAALD